MRWHARLAVGTSVPLSGMVLAAWAANAPGVYAPPPSHQAATPTSMVLVMLLAIGVAVSRREVVGAIAAIVVAMAVWVLVAHAGSGSFTPARWLFYSHVTDGRGARAALPAVPTAVSALLLGAAMLAVALRRTRTGLILAGGAVALGCVLLLGQVTSFRHLYGVTEATSQQGVSLWSAYGFTALASAVFCTRLPEAVIALLYGTGALPRAFRWSLVTAVVVPLLTWSVIVTWGNELLPTGPDRLAAVVVMNVVLLSSVAGALLLRLERNQRFSARLLHDAAHTDELTGLANRRAFLEWGADLLSESQEGVGVVVIDIDGLKAVNDEFGHRAGDALLRAAAHRLLSAVRAGDITARLGGDEFAVLTAAHDQEEISDLEARLTERLTGRVVDLPACVNLSASVGAAFGTGGDPAVLTDLIAAADARMYEHKAAAKRGVPTQRAPDS